MESISKDIFTQISHMSAPRDIISFINSNRRFREYASNDRAFWIPLFERTSYPLRHDEIYTSVEQYVNAFIGREILSQIDIDVKVINITGNKAFNFLVRLLRSNHIYKDILFENIRGLRNEPIENFSVYISLYRKRAYDYLNGFELENIANEHHVRWHKDLPDTILRKYVSNEKEDYINTPYTLNVEIFKYFDTAEGWERFDVDENEMMKLIQLAISVDAYSLSYVNHQFNEEDHVPDGPY